MFPILVYPDCLRTLHTALLLKLRMKALSAVRARGKSQSTSAAASGLEPFFHSPETLLILYAVSPHS
jgi:hypothetical protein